ncbi:4'-phosphopantetheinyl transferase family protein [Hyunsoonleella rubra]|uniref:4'-phosphopantetheinyl transferase family protein n=1 Tax=Hyunsoonleella rubra TaxID=1737062 RepID=A0ABW5TB38_9FLAO
MILPMPNNFKISDGNCHVWMVNFNEMKSNISFFSNHLSDDEKLRASKFHFKKDEERFIVFRGVLRFISGKYLNLKPEAVTFKYGEFGKPEFALKADLKFNISHSKDMAVMGFVNNFDIGIDIEFMKSDFHVMDIADNYFSKHEIQMLREFPENLQTEGFYRCWTRKEAFIKAKSKGLSFPLDAFSISIDSANEAELYETLWDANEKDLWHISPFETAKNYKAALAIKGNIENIDYFDFKL